MGVISPQCREAARSKETKKKISLALMGHSVSEETRNKIRIKNRGNVLSEEARKKIGRYWRGRSRPLETRERMSRAKKGLPILHFSIPEVLEKRRQAMHRGENHYRWIKDREKLSRISGQGERRTSAYFFWRKEVWARDNYKCKLLSTECDGRIEAHHISGYTDFPESRYQITNGITLCHAHHPRKRAEEKRLAPLFKELVSVSKA